MPEKFVALITGAGRGIGRGIALELARHGYSIAGVDIVYDPSNEQTGLFEVKTQVEKLGGEFFPLQVDIAALDSHEDLITRIDEKFGALHVVVNNAGIAPEKSLDMLETSPESYDRVMDVNARGPFFLTQRVARYMRSRKQAKKVIIFITSISAEVSSPSRAEYCLSKASLSMAAKLYADRLCQYGIRVFEVRPGIIKTDMTAPRAEKYDALIADGLVPQKRWGLPEDVGRAVAALGEGYFDYSTGLVVEVSGGMNITHL